MKSNEVNNDVYSTIILCAMSYLVGLVGWNSGINGFGVLIVLTGLWVLNKSRLSVFFVIFSYYLGACDQLFYGANFYFAHDRVFNFIFWILHQMLLASGWVIFWKKDMSRFWDIFFRLSLTYLLTIFIPPYSLLGIAHPVTAAGFFFPGTGLLGVLFFTYFTAFFAYLCLRIKQKYYCYVPRQLLTKIVLLIITVTFIFLSISDIDARLNFEQEKNKEKGRVVIHTNFGNIKSSAVFLNNYERHLALKEIVEQKITDGYRVLIFPEMIAGTWSKVEEGLWADVDKFAEEHKSAALLGVQNVISDRRYDNAIIVLGDKSLVSKKLIKARVPMPLSNWNPLMPWSASLNINRDNNGTIQINGEPVAVLICYEQMLVWPVLQSMTSSLNPKIIITISNLWWAKGTRIPKIMENTTNMWGRLFNVPILRAVNT